MSKFTARLSFPNSNNNKRLEKVAAAVDAAVGGDEFKEMLLGVLHEPRCVHTCLGDFNWTLYICGVSK